MKHFARIIALVVASYALIGCAHSSPERSGGRITLVDSQAEEDAFVIERQSLARALELGPAWFIRQLSVRPVVTGDDRFYGFQLMSLFPNRQSEAPLAIQPGDIVQRVNGQSIERPDQFMAVWASLATASHLSIQLVRDRQPLLVTLVIRDAKDAPTLSASTP